MCFMRFTAILDPVESLAKLPTRVLLGLVMLFRSPPFTYVYISIHMCIYIYIHTYICKYSRCMCIYIYMLLFAVEVVWIQSEPSPKGAPHSPPPPPGRPPAPHPEALLSSEPRLRRWGLEMATEGKEQRHGQAIPGLRLSVHSASVRWGLGLVVGGAQEYWGGTH